MNKNKIINIVAAFLTVAIVAGISTTFVVRHNEAEKNQKVDEKVTFFTVIGNADSENPESSEIQTQIVTNEKDETQTPEYVTNNKGEIITNEDGNKVTQQPTDKPPTSNSNGSTTTIPTTTGKIDASTPVTNANASQEASTFGFTWDPASGVFYSTSDPWQRQFGYNKYYDLLGGYVALWYDTVRIKFNYGGYDWLVQFWKGQYGFLLLGAEAGVYYKPEGDPSSQYICSDNNMRLKIGYTCYNKGEELFVRPYQDTWWLTGFVPGKLDKYSDRSQLKMQMRITLKDEEMKNAFVAALQQPGVGFTQGNASTSDTFYTSGNDVYLMWQTDRSKTS